MDIEDFLKQASIPIYRKQAEALEYQQQDPSARIFSFESKHLDGGRRRYVCIPLQTFYNFYAEQTSKLHFYEIVQEQRPCRAYFDLEFNKSFNESVDPIQCYEDFIQLCQDVFKRTLNIQLDKTNFLTLDSSTDTKYSSHVIVHLPDRRLFASHLILKQFVEHLTTEMIEQQKCLVMRNDEKQTFLCDTAVYTKNRNFRIYYSTKRDRDARLEYADYCCFYAKKPFDTRVFFDSLVIPNKFEDCPLIKASDFVLPVQLQANISVPQATAPHVPSVLPSICKSQLTQQKPPIMTITKSHGSCRIIFRIHLGIRDLVKSSGPSPFPELDNWFISLIRDQFPTSQIRTWTLSFLINCRYCHNLKREHKRQNVFWIINLEDFYAVQRCFDINCRSFTSESYPVPEAVKQKCLSLVESVFSHYGTQLCVEIKKENQAPDEPQIEKIDDDEIQVLEEPPKKKHAPEA
ncbi:DNA-directed primase/polymerase protein [Aphelenchoides bicaudatus]|nr:DNA-directed primase/polymerase protein [Aphelenchoides bicaudatus]